MEEKELVRLGGFPPSKGEDSQPSFKTVLPFACSLGKLTYAVYKIRSFSDSP